jgi:hypothetical protein
VSAYCLLVIRNYELALSSSKQCIHSKSQNPRADPTTMPEAKTPTNYATTLLCPEASVLLFVVIFE